jgi:hypothetical protein
MTTGQYQLRIQTKLVEAVQVSQDCIEPMPLWFHNARNWDREYVGSISMGSNHMLQLRTSVNCLAPINWGDWLVRYDTGKLEVFTAAAFINAFEPVSQEPVNVTECLNNIAKSMSGSGVQTNIAKVGKEHIVLGTSGTIKEQLGTPEDIQRFDVEVISGTTLDVDVLERYCAMQRVWRALNDGDCPACHVFCGAGNVDRLTDGTGNPPSIRCPNCKFTIDYTEIALLQQAFAPAMDAAFNVFMAWRRERAASGAISQ